MKLNVLLFQLRAPRADHGLTGIRQQGPASPNANVNIMHMAYAACVIIMIMITIIRRRIMLI